MTNAKENILYLEITPRQIQLSDATAALIRKKAEKLRRFHQRINSCRVVVEGPPGNGNFYSVRIDLTVPGGELAITQQKGENIPTAVRQAFDVARRRLDELARRQREELRIRAVPAPADSEG